MSGKSRLLVVFTAVLLTIPTLVLAWLPMTQADVGAGGWLQSGCFHPTDHSIMIVGGDLTGGLYRTDNFGQTWRPWNNGLHNFDGELTMYVEDLEPVVLDDSRVEFFAATAGGIYRTLEQANYEWAWSSRYEYNSPDPHNPCYWLPPYAGQSAEDNYATAHRRAIPFACLSWDGGDYLYAGAGRSRWNADSYETGYYPDNIVPAQPGCVDNTHTVWRLDVNEQPDVWEPMSGTEDFGSVRDLSVLRSATGDTTYVAVVARHGIFLYSGADSQWHALHDNLLYHDSQWFDLNYGSDLKGWSIHLTQRGDLYVAMEKAGGDKASGVYCIQDVINLPDSDWLYACDGNIVSGFSGSMWTMGNDGDGFVGWHTVPQFIYLTVQEGSGEEPDILYLGDRQAYFGFFAGTNGYSAGNFAATSWTNTLRGYSPGHWQPTSFEAEEGWLKTWGAEVIFHPMLFREEGPGGERYLAVQFNARFHVSADGGQTWQNAFCEGSDGNWFSKGYNQHNNWRISFMPDGRVLFTCGDTGLFRSTNADLNGFEWLMPEQHYIYDPTDNRIAQHEAYGVTVQPGWTDMIGDDPYDAIFACFCRRDREYGKLLMYREPPGQHPEWGNVMVDDLGSPLIDDLDNTKFLDIVFADRSTCFVTTMHYTAAGDTAGVLRGTHNGSWTWENVTGDIPHHRRHFTDILVNHDQGTRVFVATPWAGAADAGGVWVLEDINGDDWSPVSLAAGTGYNFRNIKCLAQSSDGSRIYVGAGTNTWIPGGIDSGVIKCTNPADATDPASWVFLANSTGFEYGSHPPIWIDDMPATWDLDTQMYHVSALAVSPTNPDVVYAGLNGFGFASIEGVWRHDGNTWFFDSQGEDYNGAGALRLAFNPYQPGQLVYGTIGLGLLFKDDVTSGVDLPPGAEGRHDHAPLLSSCRKQGATGLRFTLTRSASVQLRVFDLRGRAVRTLNVPDLATGEHVLSWDGRADDGARIASGVYMALLKAENESATTKMVLVR